MPHNESGYRTCLLIAFGVLVIIVVGICLSRNKNVEGFQTFGATGKHKNFYMNCLNECDSEPGWKSLNPSDRGNLWCAMHCDDIVSDMVKHGVPSPPVSTQESRTFARCGDYESNPECHRKSMSIENISKWCKDECAFAAFGDSNKCLKMCVTSYSPNSSFGAWSFH